MKKLTPYLLSLFSVLIIGYLSLSMTSWSKPLKLSIAHKEISQHLKIRLQEERVKRADGAIYTVDIAQLATYAALQRDHALYHELLPHLHSVIINPDSDPYTQGMVAWRKTPKRPFDASGTTEALRVAEALYRGQQAFSELDFTSLIQLIIKAYHRHSFTDQEQWLVRNYFNLHTRSFVPNSYAVDYDPDLLLELAQLWDDPLIWDLVKKSSYTLERSLSSQGLVHQVILPEIKTLTPKFDLFAFSPNGVEMLNNSLSVAERCLNSCPKVSEELIYFIEHRPLPLMRAYQAITGDEIEGEKAGIVEYSGLMRVLCRLKDQPRLTRWTPLFLEALHDFMKTIEAHSLYTLSEVLLTLNCLEKI